MTVALAAYVAVRIYPPRHYHGLGLVPWPVFVASPDFLISRLQTLGGPQTLLAAMLAQWFDQAWVGGCVTALAALLSVLAGERLLRHRAGERLPAWPSLAVWLTWLVLCNSLMFQLHSLLLLPAALWLAAAYVRLPTERAWQRPALVAPAAPLLCYAGGGLMLVFLAVCLIDEARRHRRLAVLLLLLAIEAVPWGLTQTVVDTAMVQGFQAMVPGASATSIDAVLVALLWFAYPVALLVIRPVAGGPLPPPRPLWRRALVAAGVALLFVGVAQRTWNRSLDIMTSVNYRAAHEDWDGVLREVNALPPHWRSHLLDFLTMRALYETGRLGDELFARPKSFYGLMTKADPRAQAMFTDEMQSKVFLPLGDHQLRMGLVNQSEHQAMVMLELGGAHPAVLIRLAQVSVLKNRPEAARVWLRAAWPHGRYGRQARRMLAELERDPRLAADPAVAEARANALTLDVPMGIFNYEPHLRLLLRSNPRNRRAFEYLMSYCLLACDLPGVEQTLAWLPQQNYERLPRIWEEAALLCEVVLQRTPDLGPWRIGQETRQRLREFCRAIGHDADELPRLRLPGGVERVPVGLRDDLRQTAFCHYTFGDAGVQR